MSSCGARFFSLLFLINFARKKGGNMAELTNEQKKAWAKTLYTRETLTQAEIAERVGVSRVTVNNWIGKEIGRAHV